MNQLLFSDIQEFYELTLLDESKTVQQKTAETLLIASKWEHENSIKLTDVSTGCCFKYFRQNLSISFKVELFFNYVVLQ